MDRNDAQRQVKSLCAANRLRGTFSQLSTVEKITLSTPVLHVNTCLSCYGASTQSEYSMTHLCTANNKPSDFLITSQEFKCSPILG